MPLAGLAKALETRLMEPGADEEIAALLAAAREEIFALAEARQQLAALLDSD